MRWLTDPVYSLKLDILCVPNAQNIFKEVYQWCPFILVSNHILLLWWPFLGAFTSQIFSAARGPRDKKSFCRHHWTLVCSFLFFGQGVSEIIAPVTREPGGGGGTPLCDLNRDVRPGRLWFSQCFVLNGVSISSLSVLNMVSLHELMA